MTSHPQDKLYQVDAVQEDFVFTEKVVEVFDDMLDRSVPFYRQVIQSSAGLLDQLLADNDSVYDLGCATGTTLLEFVRLLPDKNLRFFGVDNSAAMLDKARLKAELYSKKESISFINKDITTLQTKDCGAFILNYTLQFIRPLLRQNFIDRIHDNLRPGGVLLLSEKTISHDKLLNRKYINIYHEFKRKKGYSELEIAKKREALENILIPFSIDENKTILKNAGFSSVETFFQWFNFTSWIAIKKT